MEERKIEFSEEIVPKQEGFGCQCLTEDEVEEKLRYLK
jgi:hypothetical protein